MGTLAERLASVRQLISGECLRLGRVEPTLIVVTKNHPVSLVEDLYALGEREFGENRVQEGLQKSAEFMSDSGHADTKWHLIGQLQTNKVKQALEFATSIHSLDRAALLAEFEKRTRDAVVPLDVFIQINLTDDPERGGVEPDSLMAFAEKVKTVPTLNLMGLMAVATLDSEPARDFEQVAELSHRLKVDHPSATALSIGMSGDYLEALQFGATHLRIGTAITGNRQ